MMTSNAKDAPFYGTVDDVLYLGVKPPKINYDG